MLFNIARQFFAWFTATPVAVPVRVISSADMMMRIKRAQAERQARM